MFAGTDLEYHIRDRQVIIRKAISREETRPIVMQQDKVTVKGIVTDAKGEAIIGANIIEKGTTNGTITDIDGRFTLVVSEKASLVFSYIGYLTQEMLVGKKTFLNVQLQEDNKTLDEVVITGYGGTQLRSKMTNSIAKVDNSTLSTGAHTNPAQALSGAVAGLRVQQTSGNPNSTPTLVLRGGTNLDGSGSPLVIIDGAVRESLSDVNPEDIESLEVMKDAGATAIYGARASNGVILVTTKRGSEGHTEINLSAKVGFNFFHSQYEFLNAHDYLYYMRSAFYRSSHIWQDKSGAWHGFASDATLSGTQPYGTGNRYFDEKGNVLNGNKDNTAVWGVMNYTNDLAFLLKQGWQTMDDPVNPGQKLIYCDNQLKDYNIKSPAITQDYNLSVSGGNDKGHYYASLGYNRSEGNAMNNWYHRLNFTINADYKIKPWLTSNSSLTFTDAKWDDGGAGYAGEGNYSKLPKDNRWGTFPGISAGWVLSRENFMESCSNVLSYAKIRASYGANGNVSGVLDANGNVVTGLDYYTVQGSYGIMKDKDGKIVPNYNGKVPLMINDLPNPTMRWEKSYTFETGFDIGFLNNKYILNFTYYNRHTQDKFAEITLPSHSGVSSFLSNNGEVQNQGMELELTANVLRTKDWKFTVSMNTAYNKNKIISLPYNGLPNNMQDAYQVYTGRKLADGTYERQWVGGYQEGQEYGVIYAFKSLGIYKSESEIPGNLIDRSTYTENGADAKVLYGPEAWAKLSDAEKEKGLPIQAGDVKWQDVNGDGVIDDYDRVKLGNTIPHWTGGFNINTSWKGLTLNCRLDYALGYWVHDWKTPWIMGNMQGTFNTISLVKDSWSESNPNGKYPVYGWADFLGKRNYDRISDINCYRGDYLAFREISLSYSLPQSWIHKSGLSKVDVSVTAQNLGYITAAKNMATPEYGVSQNGGYPLPRTVVLGLNVTF